MSLIWHIIVYIVLGAIIGLIARALLPGKQHIGMAVTIIIGIIGAVLGGIISNKLGVGNFLDFVISVIVAMVCVWGYVAIGGRNSAV